MKGRILTGSAISKIPAHKSMVMRVRVGRANGRKEHIPLIPQQNQKTGPHSSSRLQSNCKRYHKLLHCIGVIPSHLAGYSMKMRREIKIIILPLGPSNLSNPFIPPQMTTYSAWKASSGKKTCTYYKNEQSWMKKNSFNSLGKV